jgi:thiamine-monophosphate kinase
VRSDELTIIDRYFRPLAGEGAFGLRDDAARLRVPHGFDLVVTADMLAAGVHFLRHDPPDTIARKALRVNLSDLAAKGATPLAYTLSLGLGSETDETWLAGFTEGLRRDQRLYNVDLLGGDTIAVPAGPVVGVTAFGLAPAGGMVHRFAGRAGDALFVTGAIGAATAGLALLKGRPGPWLDLSQPLRQALIERFRLPEPRLTLAPVLREFASAAMDVSDGLVGDCDKLAAASAVGARIQAERVPLPEGLGGVDRDVLAALLTGGDDYEILAAVAPEHEADFRAAAQTVGIVVARIGELREGGGPTEVVLHASPMPLYKRAYVHGGGEAP